MKIHTIFLLLLALVALLTASCGVLSFSTTRVSYKPFPAADQESRVKYPCVIDLEESAAGSDIMICPQSEGEFDRLYAIDSYITNDVSTKDGHVLSRMPEYEIE
jgi:hypothetical protein